MMIELPVPWSKCTRSFTVRPETVVTSRSYLRRWHEGRRGTVTYVAVAEALVGGVGSLHGSLADLAGHVLRGAKGAAHDDEALVTDRHTISGAGVLGCSHTQHLRRLRTRLSGLSRSCAFTMMSLMVENRRGMEVAPRGRAEMEKFMSSMMPMEVTEGMA